MNIFLSMMNSRSQSFEFKQPKVENIGGKSILTFETPKNGVITIIYNKDKDNTYPEYLFCTDKNELTYYEKEEVSLLFCFDKTDGKMSQIYYRYLKNGYSRDGLSTHVEINNLRLDLSETTLEDMFADVAKETDYIKQKEKLEEILKKHCKSESPKSESPSTLKWVLIVLGVLFMIGGFWFLNKESYEIVNAKQV
jgi:hypothetical protein